MVKTHEQIRVPWWGDEVMYWLEDQVAIVFESNIALVAGSTSHSKDAVVSSLSLDNLDLFLRVRGFRLQSFSSRHVPHPLDEQAFHPHREEVEKLEREIEELEEEIEALERLNRRHTRGTGYKSPGQKQIEKLEGKVKELEREIEKLESANHDPNKPDDGTSGRVRYRNLNSPIGKYLFPAPDGGGTVVVGFFNIKPVKTFHPSQDPRMTMAMSGGAGAPCQCESDSNTRKVVDLINGNLDKLRREANVRVVAAAPNWLGGANCYTHGCPVFPPFPVPKGDFCASAKGRWPIQIPAFLSDTSPLREMNGKGVTVFVLDSMPDLKHDPGLIKKAAKRAGVNNELLNEISEQQDRAQSPFIRFRYQDMPDLVKENADDQIVTGRDINGHLYGFHMPDHGLFVTGIIRDLACEADIEYVRVLNDFGVCSVAVLVKALEDIQARMLPTDPKTGTEGDLKNKPVVINLSLVVTPSEEDLLQAWFGVDPSHKMGENAQTKYDAKLLRSHLHKVIQSLAANGAVIVGSAGNDSNTPDMPGRIGPRYPAAFQEVIAVGAVDENGKAARYSDYPQLPPDHNGIATYGGSVPTLEDIGTDTNIDAMHGVFSDKLYPALVATNPPKPDHDPHNPTGWAYWSGTSFATPIISAVAARVLQLKSSAWPAHMRVQEVHRAILTPKGQQELLTGDQPLPTQPEFGVSLLMAYQCSEEEAVAEAHEHEVAHAD
jgi:polyhydroxyalkanoate synthesis regulator phasin